MNRDQAGGVTPSVQHKPCPQLGLSPVGQTQPHMGRSRMVLGDWVFRQQNDVRNHPWTSVQPGGWWQKTCAWAMNSWTSWMTLEAAGLSWPRDMNFGATSGRQGLRRLWLLLGPPPHLPPGFSWALAGSIRQYSGACLQPIPPQRPLSCSLRETQQPVGGTAVVQGLGKFPLAPLPTPRAPCCSLGLLGGRGAGFPPTLGF